jgi:hypothetical protein
VREGAVGEGSDTPMRATPETQQGEHQTVLEAGDQRSTLWCGEGETEKEEEGRKGHVDGHLLRRQPSRIVVAGSGGGGGSPRVRKLQTWDFYHRGFAVLPFATSYT